MSSTIALNLVFGPEGSPDRYDIAESEAVGLYLRAGTLVIEVSQRSGPVSRITVEVKNGAVTPVEFGAPARRLLWLVPRRRAIFARLGPPVDGPLLLASG